MQWKEKQYWYFVTGENMGTTMTLKPRTPHSMSEDEPACKRICVAPQRHTVCPHSMLHTN